MYPDLVGGESDGYLFVSQTPADSLEALLPEATLQLQKLEPKLLKGWLLISGCGLNNDYYYYY